MSDTTKDDIKKRYAKALEKASKEESECCSSSREEIKEAESSCCSKTVTNKTETKIPSFGSSTGLPEKANLKLGDVVVDLGSGPGHDLLR